MEAGTKPLRILICDDHRIVLDGLQRLLQETPGVECIGLAASGEEAIGFLEHVQADVLVLDLDMPGIGGEEALRRVKARWPGTKVLILTMHDGPAMVRGLMEAGADGYLLKTSAREEMRLAVKAVAQGRRHFSLEVTEALLKRPAPSAASPKLNALSLRELEVLAALAEGLSNKEIGERYFISPRTVDTHRTNLMRKLDVHNVAGLVRLAIQAGLVK